MDLAKILNYSNMVVTRTTNKDLITISWIIILVHQPLHLLYRTLFHHNFPN